MNIIRKLRNYFFYCGIEKNEYDEVKKAWFICYEPPLYGEDARE